jgi:glycosyltransferase involved in cell wall biosynthesis
MVSVAQKVSIIIPTHNRYKSLEKLLDHIAKQSYPLNLVEVVVVADGCKDQTIDMLKLYKAPFDLRYVEQNGKGAAVARNTGAAAATGDIFLFLDDDIEPSVDLVKAHLNAHNKQDRVVIGYLPFILPENAGFYHIKLWAWWEDKFQRMLNPGYRYNFEDLLSGNFSLQASLFNKVKGFDSTLRCREDYELGVRLLKAGANFIFSKEAWGYHRDVVTDLNRSLQRKWQEGIADVQFGRYHSDLIVRLRVSTLNGWLRSKSRSGLLFCIIYFSKLTDRTANLLVYYMSLLEWFRLRKSWSIVNGNLHNYWYIRGVTEALNRRSKIVEFLQEGRILSKQEHGLEVDLQLGLKAVMNLVDKHRPASIRIKFGGQLVGDIDYWPGAERLRGIHLPLLLSSTLSWETMKAIALNELLLSGN